MTSFCLQHYRRHVGGIRCTMLQQWNVVNLRVSVKTVVCWIMHLHGLQITLASEFSDFRITIHGECTSNMAAWYILGHWRHGAACIVVRVCYSAICSLQESHTLLWMQWVEFIAPPDTIKVISEADTPWETCTSPIKSWIISDINNPLESQSFCSQWPLKR